MNWLSQIRTNNNTDQRYRVLQFNSGLCFLMVDNNSQVSKNDAATTAQAVLRKIQERKLPVITLSELDSIGISYQ